MENWKVRDRQTLFSCPIMSVEQNTATNPRNGLDGKYIINHFPDWVNIIALTPERQVLLTRQYRHGVGRMDCEIPGGAIDQEDQSPLDAGLRELEEETGYIAESARIIGSTSPNPALQANSCYFILAENVTPTGTVKLDDGENIEVFLQDLKDIPKMILSGEISNAMIAAAFYALDNDA